MSTITIDRIATCRQPRACQKGCGARRREREVGEFRPGGVIRPGWGTVDRLVCFRQTVVLELLCRFPRFLTGPAAGLADLIDLRGPPGMALSAEVGSIASRLRG
jgi:hypothetical protein